MSALAEVALDPPVFDVYQPVTLHIHLRPRTELQTGSVVACQLPNSFLAFRISQSHTQRLQTQDPSAPHHVSVSAQSGATLDVAIKPLELFTGDRGQCRHGQRVIAWVKDGVVPAGSEVVFTFARMYTPWVANQEERFLVTIDGVEVEPWPTFRVRPGPAVWHRVIAPSCVRPGEPFRVLLVSLDEYDNVSRSEYAGVTLSVEGGPDLAGDLSFAGRTELEVSLPRPGVYRLIASPPFSNGGLAQGQTVAGVRSNPVRITEKPTGPYWGDLHIHTHISADAVGNEPYPYARDVSGLDFAAVADHANAHLPEQWERIKQWAREHDEPGRFVTILGYEGGVAGKRYHHNVYYPDLEVDFHDGMFQRGSNRDETALRKHLTEHGALSQLHQSGTCATDMREPYFECTRLLEIYSHWGQSECFNPDHALAYEANRVRNPETRLTLSGRGPFYARDAWALGKRYMTIASSDDHFGQGGKAHRGITGVYAAGLTRDDIFAGLCCGACYATTGERIILDFRVDDLPMGSELAVALGEELTFTVEVHGTNVLCSVEGFRYCFREDARWETVFLEQIPDRGLRGSEQCDLEVQWTERCEGAAVYYVRVRQKHLVKERPVYAWSSPVWVTPPTS